ncbi:hypothetical protein [Microbacterium sp.]|uniref:hypothetical protein n=1 Tax=Microbacterium sp. TaxID=51671 RepID=UPI0039E32AEA
MVVNVSRRTERLRVVATVTTWTAILPVFNLFVPVFAWLSASVNLLGLFGERATPEEVAEQLWKYGVCASTSVVGTALVCVWIAVLHRRHVRGTNLYVALGVSAALSIMWVVDFSKSLGFATGG